MTIEIFGPHETIQDFAEVDRVIHVGLMSYIGTVSSSATLDHSDTILFLAFNIDANGSLDLSKKFSFVIVKFCKQIIERSSGCNKL